MRPQNSSANTPIYSESAPHTTDNFDKELKELTDKFSKFHKIDNKPSSWKGSVLRTVRRAFQKSNYKSLKNQLATLLQSKNTTSQEIKKALKERSSKRVPAKTIIKPIHQTKTTQAPLSPCQASSTSHTSETKLHDCDLKELETLSTDMQKRIKSSPNGYFLSTRIEKVSTETEKEFEMIPDDTTSTWARDKEKYPKMFKRYQNTWGPASEKSLINKDNNPRVYANNVTALGQKYIAHEAQKEEGMGNVLSIYKSENVPVSVNLTNPIEKGRNKGMSIGTFIKANRSYGDTEQRIFKCPITESEEIITLNLIEEKEHKISYKQIKDGKEEEKSISVNVMKVKIDDKEHIHIEIKDWPDYGTVPLAVAAQISNIAHKAKQDAEGPIAVNCSAGIGRTGVFIAVDSILHTKQDTTDLSATKLIEEMRSFRSGVVQTAEQFQTVKQCLEYKEDIQKLMQQNHLAEEPIYVNTVPASGPASSTISSNENLYANTSNGEDNDSLYINTQRPRSNSASSTSSASSDNSTASASSDISTDSGFVYDDDDDFEAPSLSPLHNLPNQVSNIVREYSQSLKESISKGSFTKETQTESTWFESLNKMSRIDLSNLSKDLENSTTHSQQTKMDVSLMHAKKFVEHHVLNESRKNNSSEDMKIIIEIAIRYRQASQDWKNTAFFILSKLMTN